MRIGLCCNLDNAPLALKTGFDYVELPAREIDAAPRLSDFKDLPILATNVFFPDGLTIYGEEGRQAALDYARSVVPKAARLGVRVMVIGSGNARRTTGDPVVALKDFATLVAEISALAKPLAITIAPEALRAEETNVANDPVTMLAALKEASEHGAYTADIYHHLAAGVTELPAKPAHVHISNRDRKPPRPDDPEMIAFASQLKAFGYQQGVSLEAACTPAELPGALANLRALFPN
jgi:sugar phosphate isomerase/epimerase